METSEVRRWRKNKRIHFRTKEKGRSGLVGSRMPDYIFDFVHGTVKALCLCHENVHEQAVWIQQVGNLKEGDEYQWRVMAVNEAGRSKPSRPSVNVLVEEQANKPCLDLSGVRDITVKAGDDFSIHIPYVGFPLPTATWFNNDQTISDTDSRVHMQVI